VPTPGAHAHRPSLLVTGIAVVPSAGRDRVLCAATPSFPVPLGCRSFGLGQGHAPMIRVETAMTMIAIEKVQLRPYLSPMWPGLRAQHTKQWVKWGAD
jgi:hypothetical protein